MLLGIIAVAVVSVFSGGAGRRAITYPFLRSFLESSNAAATDAIRGDVQAACADPHRWLNPAGHDLLSELPGFAAYNASMLWGTYRPGVYFGFKTRTSPLAVTGGLMWHEGDGSSGNVALRHECSEGDGLGPYGWVEHDGRSYGRQDIEDRKAGVRLVTSMVKPAQLDQHGGHLSVGGDAAGVHLASRIQVFPSGTVTTGSGDSPRPSTIYFYVGLDCGEADTAGDESCLGAGRSGAGLVVVDESDPSSPRRSLLVRGAHPQHGGFEMEATAAPTRDSGGPSSEGGAEGGGLALAFLGKSGAVIADMKREVEKLLKVHRLTCRSAAKRMDGLVTGPFVLPNKADHGSNAVLIQVTGIAPFAVDFVVRASGAGQDNVKPSLASEGAAVGAAARPFVSSSTVSGWLESGSRSFSDRFRETFSLEGRGFEERDVAAAKAALSNMLGGMGHFTGRSEVRGAGTNGDNGFSFGASLFTAVPSRSFFPRGFLWDEGFHQLLVSVWDRDTSVDVLGHWLSMMHMHDTAAGGAAGTGCSGGWLPREQILGEEARRRVPAAFMAQDISVANPPTLLLLVDNLLHDLRGPASGEGSAPSAEACTAEAKGDTLASSQGCAAAAIGGDRQQELGDFLRKAHPLLDLWLRWLLITQRPGVEGWGGQVKGVPLGAFQWRGRDPGDDRLNALTLASGLDDYPRASHPSQTEECHVDVSSWLALGCRVMQRLSVAIGVEGSVPYGDLFDEVLGGIFDLHWEQEEEAFFDRGIHVPDGELVEEVVMRCRNADGSTEDLGVPLADIQARKAVCRPGQQHMYPLGDGRGGLLTRRRWKGSSPRPQHVQHIGYVSIFPLLLKLLPPESEAVGSLLAHMRDSTQLWSPYGLRSLSASDPFYQVENNPGDEPYWRGHIWVNINYLALAALRHYSQAEGPFSKDASRIYSELRTNLLRTLLEGYHSTGYFWEQYDDRSGRGFRSHPFTGWTALVVLIMAEMRGDSEGRSSEAFNMPASVKSPVFTSMVHRKVQPQTSWQDAEFHGDDFGLDLMELSGVTGFLMNEVPDNLGHFYPPWANDPALAVKDEPLPFMMPEPAATAARPQQQQQQQEEEAQLPSPEPLPAVAPVADPTLDVVMGGATGSRPKAVSTTTRLPRKPAKAAGATTSAAGVAGGAGSGVGATFRKTAAGGVTRRRSSSKEEQAKKRRERNRVLARRTRLRKKFFFQSLQQQVARLQRENERLKSIVTTRCPGSAGDILMSCASQMPSMVADSAGQATALLDQSGFLLVKALQSSQPSFCVTDPQMPDNPIVYASDSFIELTGYSRAQVLGRNCRFLQGPDTDPDAVAKIRKGIEEGSDTSVYLRQYKADGTVFWNHVFVAALRNGEDKIINYVGIQHPLDKEPSPEVVACINNGEDQEQESAQEDERQMGLEGQWQEGGSGDLTQLDHFIASEWGTD
eukprot:g7940.t1